jgi:predicted dehydrogenase
MHAPATIAAARAGKHVLVEKPIATTLEDADAMIAAADAARVTLMVAHNQRFFPEHQRIKRLLDDGAIGVLECVRADHNQDFRPPEDHWILDASEAGGGAFIGYGVHRIDLLRWFAGEVTEIAHFQRHRPGRFGGESCSVSILKFESGAIGEIAINWAVQDSPWMDMLYLAGDKGSIHNVHGLYVSSASVPEKVEVPQGNAFALQLRHFAECVLTGREPLTSGRDARKTLEVCLAGYRSVETGQIVRTR